MASTSGTASTSTAAVGESNDDRNKTVTGYPIQSSIVTGYPRIPAAESVGGRRTTTITATFYTVHGADHQSSLRPPLSTLMYRLTYAVFTAGILMISGFLIFWLLLRPHFPEFQIASASISAINATNPTSPFAVWNLSILVKNPNKKLTISYDHFQTAVAYDNYLLSQTELPPFRQLKSNQTRVEAEFGITEASVGQNLVGEILSWKARGTVEFGVRLIAWVRFRTGHWWFRSHLMVVYCPGLYLGFSPENPNGAMLNPNKQCQMAVLKSRELLIWNVKVSEEESAMLSVYIALTGPRTSHNIILSQKGREREFVRRCSVYVET